MKKTPKTGRRRYDRFGVERDSLKVKPAPKERIDLSRLDAAERKKLPSSAFAIPPDKYPIHDLAHAKAALSRVAQFGSPEEKRKVARAVARRYGIGPAVNDDRQGKTKSSFSLSSDHSSSTHPWPPNKGGQNWIERVGGKLPSFIKRVAKHIMADSGYSQSRAIAAAISQCKKGRLGAKGLAAAAQWEALKARANG